MLTTLNDHVLEFLENNGSENLFKKQSCLLSFFSCVLAKIRKPRVIDN